MYVGIRRNQPIRNGYTCSFAFDQGRTVHTFMELIQQLRVSYELLDQQN
jgi:hypothetical protein